VLAAIACIPLLCLGPGAGAADEIGEALEASMAAQRAARESQQRVNRLDDEANALREKAQQAQWQALQQSAYAEQLEKEAAVEEKRRGELEAELARVAATGTDLQPLMQRMVAELEAFVAADLPFLAEARRERVTALKALLADPGKRSTDKFRRVLEAYRTEVEYGYTLGVEDVSTGCGQAPGAASRVRVGRVALFCLAADGASGARWDRGAGRWAAVDGDTLEEIQRAARLARGEKPELLVLPVPAAERAGGAAP
jgi:hypothetical protein